MDRNTVRVSFSALAENQGLARTVVSGYLALSNPTLEELTEVKTAVSEAVSNCIIHGYRGLEPGRVDMEMEMSGCGRCEIKITDYGRGIDDVEKAREPMFSTEKEKEMSGMGFTVMESFMDKVVVNSKPGEGTQVVLIKSLDVCDA